MKLRDFLKISMLAIAVPFVFAACDKDNDPTPTPTPEPEPVPTEKKGLIVFNSGNQGASIDGSLSIIQFAKGEVENNVFAEKNGRSLGGTPQNGAIFNDNLYIAVYGSRTIEVVNKLTMQSVKQITIPTSYDDGPRYVVADDKYVYASLYSGEVIRINPETNEIDKDVKVGPNPEEMVVLNGFLYVVNSDGLNYESGYVNGKSVSKIDLASFTEMKKIEIGINPTRIATDGTNVYALSMGDYGAIPSSIYKIDANDQAVNTGKGASWMAIHNGVLYTINSVFNPDWSTTDYYISYKLSDMSVLSDNFLGDKKVDAPAGIAIDTVGGQLFVSSYNLEGGYASYTTDGYVNQYDLTGKFVKRYDVGVSPCYMLVLR